MTGPSALFCVWAEFTKYKMKSLFANPPTENSSAADQEAAYQSWVVVCAKAGQPDAAQIRPGGTENENKEKRNSVRRAINAIHKNIGSNNADFTIEVTQALAHAGQLIYSIDNMIDGLASHSDKTRNTSMKVMRNAADFSKHYGADGGRSGDEGEMGIADFLRGAAKMKSSTAVQNALATGTDTSGGFTVPSRLMPGILAALVPVSSLLRAGASIVPLDEGAKSFTTAAVNSIPTAAWRAEAGILATSDPVFRAVVAAPKSLAFQFKISRELLADGQNITEALYLAIAQAFSKELDRAGLRGSGASPEPLGLLNLGGVQAVNNGANGASLATVRYGNVFSAVQALLQANAAMPTAAIMSPRSLVGLGQLYDTIGQPVRVPEMLTPIQLIGTSQIPNNLTVGTSSDCSEIYVGDFSNLYFMLRENVSVQVLSELYAGTGEIGFACHVRADVMCTYPAAFAVVTGVRP